MRCDAWVSTLLWWSCQSPVAHSCGLLNPLNSFHGGMSKLNIKFDADSLLYLLSHFECDGHTVYIFTQWCLPPQLTSTVKSSLFTHVHSSSLSLAARLHLCCCANHSRYINNGWTFPRQTSYIYLYILVQIYISFPYKFSQCPYTNLHCEFVRGEPQQWVFQELMLCGTPFREKYSKHPYWTLYGNL